jgi:glycosyltransferase involved in cell wall biosynthesis
MHFVLEDKREIIPLVSVFIPAFNAEAYIEQAVNSVLSQTYQHFEIIVVNDGSTDETKNVLEEIAKKDKRIKVFHNDFNLGLSPTRNKGIALCKGEFIALLDADDLISNQRIEKQVHFLKSNPEFDAVSSWMQIFDVEGYKQIIQYREKLNDYKSASIFYSPVSHAAALFKRSVLQVLKYRIQFKFAEDYDMWFRFLKQYKVAVLPEALYFYRAHASQTINDVNKKAHDYSHLQLIKEIQAFFKIPSTEQNLNVHLQFCMNSKSVSKVNELISLDSYLQFFLNSDTAYLDHLNFKKFVYTNYWQTPFFKFWPQLKFSERIKMLQSPFCMLSFCQKIKLFLK